MKYLKKFEAFNQKTLDDILDKINKTGYSSLNFIQYVVGELLEFEENTEF